MKKDEFELARFYLQDSQRLIAAGKTQRWEIVKWAVTVNLAMATVSLATNSLRPLIFFFCCLVAGAANILIYHYNKRMTGARKASRTLENKLSKEITDIEKLTGEPPYRDGELKDYDRSELVLFTQIIWGSTLPALFVLVASLAKY